MTREEAIRIFRKEIECMSHTFCTDCPFEKVCDPISTTPLDSEYIKAYDMAIEALSTEPCREVDDYENEIADLHNRLDIAEYDKERLREEVTALEEKLKVLSAEPCEDAISRQAVMDFIRGLTRWCVRSEDGKFNNVGLLYDDVMFGLDRLPSVTPKQKIEDK